MNPESFKLPLPWTTAPKPPDETVLHAEITRHGGIYVPSDAEPLAEASYQVEVIPPVPKQAQSQRVVIDPSVLEATGDALQPEAQTERKTTTWASSTIGIGSLAPPVLNLLMNSPGAGGSVPPGVDDSPSRTLEPQLSTEQFSSTTTAATPEINIPNFYDTRKPTCSLNLVCYRFGTKGCDLQQIQCILRTKFPSDESFQTTIEANQHLVYSDDRFSLRCSGCMKPKCVASLGATSL